jgi:AcrR family transcriptional regulator
MARWQPNARSRLEQAALELYSERGFQQTTVAEIAERAGLTERTFFRHFADKREVLFSGGGMLEERMLGALERAPGALSAIDAIGEAVADAIAPLNERRSYARKRQAVIAANPELQERERIKLASLASALAGGLRRRGIGDLAAALAAEMGVAVFRIAFDRWLHERQRRDIAKVFKESLSELKALTAAS